MDYNNISNRLKRTLNSLNGRFNDDIVIEYKHVKTEKSETFYFNPGNQNQEDLINKIFIILYNLSSLKDNLKNCLEQKGLDKNLIEDLINNSIHLQVLIDIVNQEKHGYPLTKTNRSGKNPVISDIHEVLGLIAGPEPNSVSSISFDGSNFNLQGKQQMKIVATIFDGNNSRLFSLDELVSTSYEKFESFAITHNCC
jgi:hypothetical protein